MGWWCSSAESRERVCGRQTGPSPEGGGRLIPDADPCRGRLRMTYRMVSMKEKRPVSSGSRSGAERLAVVEPRVGPSGAGSARDRWCEAQRVVGFDMAPPAGLVRHHAPRSHLDCRGTDDTGVNGEPSKEARPRSVAEPEPAVVGLSGILVS